MKNILKKNKKITATEFDSMFEKGGNISDYLDIKKAVVIKRVNIDFPEWMANVWTEKRKN